MELKLCGANRTYNCRKMLMNARCSTERYRIITISDLETMVTTLIARANNRGVQPSLHTSHTYSNIIYSLYTVELRELYTFTQ